MIGHLICLGAILPAFVLAIEFGHQLARRTDVTEEQSRGIRRLLYLGLVPIAAVSLELPLSVELVWAFLLLSFYAVLIGAWVATVDRHSH